MELATCINRANFPPTFFARSTRAYANFAHRYDLNVTVPFLALK